MTSIKIFSIYLASLLVSCAAQAQSYYPAGLGNSNLQLWLTASDPTTLLTSSGTQAVNGNAIATWVDKSGRSANAVQTTVGDQPVYNTNVQNGLGAVIFQNTNQYMTGISGAYQTIVSAREMLGTSYQYLFSSPANTDFSVRFSGSTTTSVSYTDGPNVNDWNYNTGSPTTMWINGTQGMTGTTINHILVDEATGPTNATYSLSSTFMSRGMYNNDPVYELLAYNTTLSTTARRLLENYEAAQWGMYSNLPSSGYTVFTPPTVSTYNKNLVGIGYTSSTDNFLSDVAGSTDGLGFSSGSGSSDFLKKAGYLMAAHNGQANTVIKNPNISNVPANTLIWNRSWYLQLTGGNSSGNVTLNFNYKDYNGSIPNASYSYKLFYNATDGSFATGTNVQVAASSTSISGNTVSFVVTASSLATGYYTIIASSSTSLPMFLQSFTVKNQNTSALVEWSTSKEVNSNYFIVQRSVNGSDFTTIGTVKASGQSSITVNYNFTDNSPLSGTSFYRLVMVDLDGDQAFSPIAQVYFAQIGQAPIKIYPNPATDMLYISSGSANGNASIQIFNTAGQLIKTYQSSAINSTSISISNLAKGIYFIKIDGPSISTIEKIIKQ